MGDQALGALLLQFAVAYGCMLVIPGPNTVLMLRASDGTSMLKPLLAAAGIACGATLASIVAASSAAALPTGAVFRSVSGILVAALLLRTAFQAYRGARGPGPAAEGDTAQACVTPFLLGFGVAALNPVSVPYFASFFISHACGRTAQAMTCALVFVMAGLWFSSVGLASAHLGRLPLPVACRRAGDLTVAAILTTLAIRHLWMTLA